MVPSKAIKIAGVVMVQKSAIKISFMGAPKKRPAAAIVEEDDSSLAKTCFKKPSIATRLNEAWDIESEWDSSAVTAEQRYVFDKSYKLPLGPTSNSKR